MMSVYLTGDPLCRLPKQRRAGRIFDRSHNQRLQTRESPNKADKNGHRENLDLEPIAQGQSKPIVICRREGCINEKARKYPPSGREPGAELTQQKVAVFLAS